MQKNTTNKVLLSHLGGLGRNDLEFIENKFNSLGIILTVITPNNENINYLEDFSLQTFYVFSSPFLIGIVDHSRSIEVWKKVKAILTYTKKKLEGTKYESEIQGNITLRPIKFGINIILDVNTSYNFNISEIPNDDKFLDLSLDKVLSFLVGQSPNKNYELPSYVKFSLESRQWKSESFNEYLLRQNMCN